MNLEEPEVDLIKFLKENLKVELETGYNPPSLQPLIRVKIMLGDEEITSAEDVILK